MQILRTLKRAILLLAVVGLSGGCRERDSMPARGNTTPSDSAAVASQAADASPVTISIADRDAYDALLASLRGKVVLVDFWATWCGPCVEQFPHTVELWRNSDPHELAVVSVSMDEPSDEQSVRAFLQAQGASFPNLLSRYGVGAEGFEAFEIEDGAVPHYKIYDRSGKLRHQATSSEQVGELVQQLLGGE